MTCVPGSRKRPGDIPTSADPRFGAPVAGRQVSRPLALPEGADALLCRWSVERVSRGSPDGRRANSSCLSFSTVVCCVLGRMDGLCGQRAVFRGYAHELPAPICADRTVLLDVPAVRPPDYLAGLDAEHRDPGIPFPQPIADVPGDHQCGGRARITRTWKTCRSALTERWNCTAMVLAPAAAQRVP